MISLRAPYTTRCLFARFLRCDHFMADSPAARAQLNLASPKLEIRTRPGLQSQCQVEQPTKDPRKGPLVLWKPPIPKQKPRQKKKKKIYIYIYIYVCIYICIYIYNPSFRSGTYTNSSILWVFAWLLSRLPKFASEHQLAHEAAFLSLQKPTPHPGMPKAISSSGLYLRRLFRLNARQKDYARQLGCTSLG